LESIKKSPTYCSQLKYHSDKDYIPENQISSEYRFN
jgi:hypothetical protein